jgi:hypothetical protein
MKKDATGQDARKAVLAGFNEDQIKQLLGEIPEHSKSRQAMAMQLRQINGWIGSVNQRLKALAEKGQKPESAQVPIDSDAMKRLREDLPDVAAALEAAIAATPGVSKVDLERVVGERVAMAQQDWRAQQTKASHRELFRAHPELRDAAAKAAKGTLLVDVLPGFKLWLAAQPPDYQKDVNDAEDWGTVSEAFTKFKGWQRQRERNQSRLSNAVTPSGVPASAPTTESAESAFLRGFNGG